MQRRIALRWLVSLAGAIPVSRIRVWAQTAAFPVDQGDALRALASVVLPSALGPDGLDKSSAAFERWVREYRPGAETEHGYGITRIRYQALSPAPAYLSQLKQLREVLLHGSGAEKARRVREILVEAGIAELPRFPEGKHVAVDLMAFFFRSSDANDLCYRAAIGRDRCRGLADSRNPPTALKERA